MGVGLVGSVFDLFVSCLDLAQFQVFPNAGVEEIGVLGYQSDLPPQVLEFEVPQIVSAEAHVPFAGVPESHDQVGAGGLARAGPSDQRHSLSGLNIKCHTMQGLGLAVTVGEPDMVEAEGR